MRTPLALAAALALAAGLGALSGRWGQRAHAQGADSAEADAQTARVADSALAFLSTLTSEQRRDVQFAFTPQTVAVRATFERSAAPDTGPGAPRAGAAGPPPGSPSPRGAGPGGPPHGSPPPGGFGKGRFAGFVGEQYGRAVWSNFPVSDVPRPGLRLGALTAPQRAAALRLLQTALSPQGYAKVSEVMGSDQALAEAGQPFAAGRDAYTLAMFGAPGSASPWMIQFGGHHLALNLVVAGRRETITPVLTGAQPAIYTQNGRTVRALAQENDKAFALLNALDAGQRKQAILTYEIGDLVLGPGHDGETIAPEGLKGAAMSPGQRRMLLALIGEWTGLAGGPDARARLAEVEAGLNDTWFAWSGPTEHAPGRNGSAYYRLQGPSLVIEFSPQGVGGDPTMHVHTIYRDPRHDYGRVSTHP